MVNHCMVPGCSSRTRKIHGASIHSLPRDLDCFKKWLRVINNPNFGEDTAMEARKNQRVCSLHFKPEDFELNVLGMKRAALLKTAIPSIFTFPGAPGTSSAKRICLKTQMTSAAALVEHQPAPISSTQVKIPPSVQTKFTAPCEESCTGITFDVSEFTFDEENGCSNEQGGEAEKENNCSKEGGGEEEEEEEEEEDEEIDDSDSDWEMEDSNLLESDESNQSRSHDSDQMDSDNSDERDSEMPKSIRQLCPECGAFFFTCKAHTCEYKIKPLSCNICGKRCADESSLKAHSKIHEESYEHPCKFCMAPFKTRLDKLAHESTHTRKAKPYECPDCPMTFAKLPARNLHLKGHRGPKTFSCPHCALEFRTVHYMERHIVVHTGIKEFVCEFCSRSFNQPGHLKSHLRVHTREKPYQCQHCDKSFNHNVSLKSHVMRYHKGAVDTGPSGPVKRTKRAILQSMGRPKGRPKRNAAAWETNSVPAV